VQRLRRCIPLSPRTVRGPCASLVARLLNHQLQSRHLSYASTTQNQSDLNLVICRTFPDRVPCPVRRQRGSRHPLDGLSSFHRRISPPIDRSASLPNGPNIGPARGATRRSQICARLPQSSTAIWVDLGFKPSSENNDFEARKRLCTH
jgi:hypothetical protein